ncbi:hypothetical protein LOTGIDRAFT_158655 [Lottia gigantea]|uniref:Uncharacterized protein n=1 Tax=Lottia gigantea TaxID=225164 RepID=V4A463_LOTGI|nr:hypothetical protein LOTGIDRAFT_158655 [Lottia gigantea]ESO98708.1 hypothetical protein LOTGIDRAFT_158655 [Lottia gigantea]
MADVDLLIKNNTVKVFVHDTRKYRAKEIIDLVEEKLGEDSVLACVPCNGSYDVTLVHKDVAYKLVEDGLMADGKEVVDHDLFVSTASCVDNGVSNCSRGGDCCDNNSRQADSGVSGEKSENISDVDLCIKNEDVSINKDVDSLNDVEIVDDLIKIKDNDDCNDDGKNLLFKRIPDETVVTDSVLSSQTESEMCVDELSQSFSIDESDKNRGKRARKKKLHSESDDDFLKIIHERKVKKSCQKIKSQVLQNVPDKDVVNYVSKSQPVKK